MSKNLATETAAALDQIADTRDPEILAELFAPEIVCPIRSIRATAATATRRAKALMLVVLEDGIRRFQDTRPALEPRLRSRPRERIRADYSGPSALNNVCGARDRSKPFAKASPESGASR
jgi:hypothetical protein